MRLMPVQIREEDNPRLVGIGRLAKDVARERHGGRQRFTIGCGVAAIQRVKGVRRGWRDGVEDSEERVAVPRVVAQDQPVVVEVVAGVHAHAGGQPSAHMDLLLGVEKRDLYAVDLGAMRLDQRETDFHGGARVSRAPIACELRVEHVAEPVQDHGLPNLAQHGIVDLQVVIAGARHAGQSPTRHENHAPAPALDVPDLLFIGPLDVGQARALRRGEMIRARPAGNDAADRARFVDRPGDQLARRRPIESHAPLGRVHRFGDRKPK